jgi:KTSC domain
VDMYYVRGRRANLVSVGWQDHVLQVEFKDGRRYQFGGVPVEVKDKLLRVPYPDKLFQQLVKGKFVSKRVDTPPVAKPLPEIEYGDLPF